MAGRGMTTSLLLALTLAALALGLAEARARPPAIFVFGDSLADVGNNNYLPDGFRADFPFNGMDFPDGKPTGRFTNGYNLVDVIAQHMGFRTSPPPFLALTTSPSLVNHAINGGVNFASGGAGIFVSCYAGAKQECINTKTQIQYLATVRSNLTRRFGVGWTDLFLSKSIFLISVGSNDIFDFYENHRSCNWNERKQLVANLSSGYMDHLKALYNLGARKFAIINIPVLGCVPMARATNFIIPGCNRGLSDYARALNSAIIDVTNKLSSTMKGMKYSIGNTYKGMLDLLNNRKDYGIKNVERACCGDAYISFIPPKFNVIYCTPEASYCSNRTQYVFWDVIHPTEAVCKVAGGLFYGGSPPFVHPINFKQLVKSGSSTTLESSVVTAANPDYGTAAAM